MPKFTWNIDPALLHLGSYELRYYSLIFVAVFLGGYQLLRWQIMRGGGEERDASDFFVYGVLAVLIGARLGHVLFYDLEKAMQDPLWVLKIWTGGLASHGATVGLIVAMWLFTRKRGIAFIEGADRFSFAAALGAALVRLGNFFNSEIVGRVTDQSWGVRFPRFDGPNAPYRHPSQLYEFVLGGVVFLGLWLVDRIAGRERRPRGLLISTFFVLYFTGRFLVEYVKEYQVLSIEHKGGLTMGQMLSIPAILLGIMGIVWSLRTRVEAGWVTEEGFDEGDEEGDDEDEGDEEEGDENAEDDELASSAKASKPSRQGHDADVDEEFSRSADERRELTRKGEKG